jgi:predicted lipid-binding transport protein (Tim44 family)
MATESKLQKASQPLRERDFSPASPAGNAWFSEAASTAGSTAGGALLGGAAAGVAGAFVGGAVGLIAGLVSAASYHGIKSGRR